MKEIFLLINNQKYGPYNETQIEKWIEDGRVNKNTMCWYSGLNEWEQLGDVFPQYFQTVEPPPPPDPKANSEAQKGAKGCCFGCLIAFLIVLTILIISGYLIYKYGKTYYYQFEKEYRYNSLNLNTPYRKNCNFTNIFYG